MDISYVIALGLILIVSVFVSFRRDPKHFRKYLTAKWIILTIAATFIALSLLVYILLKFR